MWHVTMDLKIHVLSCTPAKDKYISHVPFVRNTVLAFYAEGIWTGPPGTEHSGQRLPQEQLCRPLLPHCLVTCWCYNSTRSSTCRAGRWQWGLLAPGSWTSQLPQPWLKGMSILQEVLSLLLCYSSRKQMKTMFQRVEYITPHFKTWVHLFQ